MKPDVSPSVPPGSQNSAAALVDHLAARREMILEEWHADVSADPALTTSDGLSRTQFRDHIPEVLDEFSVRLLEGMHSHATSSVGQESRSSIEHGEHRWLQGYDLREVILEWGHLHHCLLDALESARAALPDLAPEIFVSAHRSLADLIHLAIADSTEQFARLQQKDAIRERADLEGAVAHFIENDGRRVKLWREASHDLRGQLSIIASATSLLDDPALDEPLRAESLGLLQKGTRTLKEMLTGALEDTHQNAGREDRRLTAFDAGLLLGNLCAVSQPLARERGLRLRLKGPPSLAVEGDRGKVQRIAQNLLLNALRYTDQGEVTLSWQADDLAWWSFQVRDTGPGMPGAGVVSAASGMGQRSGEGLGLSIVRRLGELLGGRLRLETDPGAGTVFTVTLPRSYAG